MKSVRCALLAVAAMLILAGAAGAPFNDGQRREERSLALSKSGLTPFTVEAWEQERAAFVQRMKREPEENRVTFDEARRQIAGRFAAGDAAGAEKAFAAASSRSGEFPEWQMSVIHAEYNAGKGRYRLAAKCMVAAVSKQKDDPEHNGASYARNLIWLGDLWGEVRIQLRRDGDSAGQMHAWRNIIATYMEALRHCRNHPDIDPSLSAAAKDRMMPILDDTGAVDADRRSEDIR